MGSSGRGSTSMSSTSTAIIYPRTNPPKKSPTMSIPTSYFSQSAFRKQRSFMEKLFSRQMSSRGSRSTAGTSEVKGYVNGFPITECPYIRPLKFKLTARDERPSKSDLKTPQKTLSQNSRVIEFDLGNRSDGNLSLRYPNALRICKSQPIMSAKRNYAPIEELRMSISRGIEEQRQDIAIEASPDSSRFVEWLNYLQSYSEGRFNLIAPPNPPARSNQFKYLPAVYPYNEAQRISASNEYDFVWPHWDEEKAGALIVAALKKFDAQYAAISFFDDELETFKAENGYNTLCVPRESSIAAHVLLSEDTFVVLDTKEDWRFAQNPLVTGHPNIRFFAGAPMLAPGGEVVGVFALFDKKPRTSFTHFQKRELAEFGQLAMTDLNLQMKWLSDPDVRSTPILQRSSLINADTQPARAYAPTLSPTPTKSATKKIIDNDLASFGTGILPQALRYHKVSNLQALDSLYIPKGDQLSLQEPTPPSSSGSGADVFMDLPKGFGKNHKQLSVDSRKSPRGVINDMVTPDSEAFLSLSPRPFSSSDITSLFPHPPNTPEVPLSGFNAPVLPQIELTIENFMSLTDFDCAEPSGLDENDDSPSDQEGKDENAQPSMISRGTSSITGLSPAPLFSTTARKHDSISTDMSSRSSFTSYMSGETRMFMAEAAFSCSFTAQSFGYDLVYAARVEPTRLFMTEEELVKPGGVTVKIVVAYGLHRRMVLDTALHLKVLRSSGLQTIEHIADYQYQEDEYETGHLFRMSEEDGPVEKCRSGLVFGAFRRPNNKHIQTLDPSQQRFEVEKLMTAASALNKILSKAAARRSRALSSTEPNSPTEHYPAHEAAEF